MKIITITLNPAFDVHCSAEHFEACHENLATITEREAGGKGVNISRALAMNGVDNLALLAVGDANGADFCRELDKDGMKYDAIELKGRIRENITSHTKDAPETRLSFTGFATDESLLAKFEEKLLPMLESGDIVTFTGSVPSGISIAAVKDFIAKIKNTGAKALYESGIENVMISLGSKGALLVCADGAFIAHPPKIKAISTIGAGDSSIGGFLAAAAAGKGSAEMIKTAVSYGSAACMSAGTRPPVPADVERVYREVTVETL